MRLRALLLAVWASSLPLAPPAMAAATPGQGLEVQAVRSVSDGRLSLVLSVPTASARPAVTALAGGQELPTVVAPVLSDRTALALVLDASAEGGPALRGGGLSGAVDFLVQLPPGARTAVIADRRPPEVAAGSTVGISDDLRATSSLRSAGPRATSEALTLALRELAVPSGGSPVIVLYTTASTASPDGDAAALAARFQAAGAILAVVTTSADDAYWPAVATATGGVAVRAAPERSLEAFDAVAEALRRRHTVTLDQPADGASAMTLRVALAGGTEAGRGRPVVGRGCTVRTGRGPAAAVAVAVGRVLRGARGTAVVASGAALLIATLGAVLLYRRRAPGHHATEAPREPAAEPSLFESRAEVNPADPEHQRELAAEYQRQAGSDRAGGRVALAASGYRQAIDALAQRVTLDPGQPHLPARPGGGHHRARGAGCRPGVDGPGCGWVPASRRARRAPDPGGSRQPGLPPHPGSRPGQDGGTGHRVRRGERAQRSNFARTDSDECETPAVEMTWPDLVDAIEHRLARYTGRPTYERAVFLVVGFDLAQPTSRLAELQTRIAGRHATGALGWEGVLLAEAIGADPQSPPPLGPLSGGDDARAIAALIRELRALAPAPSGSGNPWATTESAMTGEESRRAADWIGGPTPTPANARRPGRRPSP